MKRGRTRCAAAMMLLGALTAAGCGGGQGREAVPTGGAGIPGVRGPASPNAKAGPAAGKAAPRPRGARR